MPEKADRFGFAPRCVSNHGKTPKLLRTPGVYVRSSGFSKAISNEMPLTKDLSKEVVEHYSRADTISPDVRRMIEEDFEKALTFLAQNKPWLPESENLRHKALYLDLTYVIRGIFHERFRGPLVWGSNKPPLWLEALITHWHNNRATVITLNYDTLVERVASSTYWEARSTKIPTGQLYPIPLTPAAQRSRYAAGVPGGGGAAVETFRLLKLHGSTNWFYSGRTDFFGEELFYVPCIGGVDGPFVAREGRDPEKPHWTNIGDKTALIIPPVLDKSVFFQHESLRSLWFQASQAIKTASRVVCMGYSLPSSDLTMAQFLKSSAPSQRVPFEIVDVSPKLEHFPSVLGETPYEFKQGKADLNCVARFVVQNCIPNQKDKMYVIHMTSWKEQPASGPPEEIKTAEKASP